MIFDYDLASIFKKVDKKIQNLGLSGIDFETEKIKEDKKEILQKEIVKLEKIHKDLEENNNNLQKQQDELTNEYDNKKNKLSIIEQEYEEKVNLIASLENRITVLEADIKNMRAELYGLNKLKEYTNSISSLISSFNESINKVTYNEHQNDETAQYRSAYCIEQTKYNLQKKIFIGSLDDLIDSEDNTQKTIIQYVSPSWNKFEYLWYSGLEELWYLAHKNKDTDYLFIIRNSNLSIIESYAGILLDIYLGNRRYNPMVKEDMYAYMPTNLYIMFVPVNNDEKYEYSLPINPQLIENVNNIG